MGNLDIADVLPESDRQIYIQGKKVGTTNITLYDQNKHLVGIIDLDVTLDIEQISNAHDVNQVPWLGSVPVLGTLFSSKSYQLNETDLVVIVSPHLVAPAAPGQVLATPLDKETPSNDIDFFLVGNPSVRKQYTDYVISGGGMQGPYGYIMPRAPAPN
jgi:Flp pilus assembly secretin CpaC